VALHTTDQTFCQNREGFGPYTYLKVAVSDNEQNFCHNREKF
jgi:hypothetical protein